MEIRWNPWRVERLYGASEIVVCRRAVSAFFLTRNDNGTCQPVLEYLHNTYWNGIRVFDNIEDAQKAADEANGGKENGEV